MKKLTHKITILLSITLASLVLAACSTGKTGAVTAVEAYIQALGSQDTNQISTLSCKDWEQNALTEVDSLTSVGSSVKDLVCKESGEQGSDVLVSCSGSLELDYNGEAQHIDLSNRIYIARQEGGEWRMCGYK